MAGEQGAYRTGRMRWIVATACLIWRLHAVSPAQAWQFPVFPPDPPGEVAADLGRLANFELAQLRQGLAISLEKEQRLMSAAQLRLQAAVAYERAGMTADALREMTLGLRQTASLKQGFPPIKLAFGPGHGLLFPERRSPAPLSWSRVSDDGRWFCRAEQTGWMEVWDLESGTLKQRFLANDQLRPDLFKMRLVVFTPDARRAICLAHNSTEYWNLETGELAYRFEPQPRTLMTKIALSPDGKQTVLGRHDGKLVFAAVEQPDVVETVTLDDYSDHQVIEYSPSGQRLLVSRISHNRGRAEVIVFDVAKRAEIFRHSEAWSFAGDQGAQPTMLPEFSAWGPTEDTVFVVRGVEGKEAELLLMNLKTKEVALQFPFCRLWGMEGRVLWDELRQRIITFGGDQPVRIYDYPSGKLQLELPNSAYTNRVFILQRPFSGYVYVSSKRGERSRLWKADGAEAPYWELPPVIGVAEAPQQQMTAFFSENLIQVYAGDRPFPVHRLEMPDVAAVQFLKHGTQLLASGENRRQLGILGAQLWSFFDSIAASPQQEYRHPQPLAGMHVQADGSIVSWGGTSLRAWRPEGGPPREQSAAQPIVQGIIAGASLWTLHRDGQVSQWSLADLQPVAERMLGGALRQIRAAADGRVVLGWDQDFRVQLWSWPEGKLLAAYEHPRDLAGGYVANDGQRACTWSIDNTLFVWDAQQARPASWKCPVFIRQAALWGEASDRVAVLGVDHSLWLGAATDLTTIRSIDPLSDEATPAIEALARQIHPPATAARQAQLRMRRNERQETQLVDATSQKVIPWGPIAMDIYGTTTPAAGVHLLPDGVRLLRWGAGNRVILANRAGIELQVFQHGEDPSSAGGAPTSATELHVAVDEERRRLITADASGSIRVWQLPGPLPETPQAALLDVELRCKYQIDRFGQFMWLKPEELQQRVERRDAPP